MATDHDINSLSAQALRELDRVCTRFEQAWKSGRHPRIEDYVADASAADRETLLQELLLVELDCREREGGRPCQQEYESRFADRSDLVAQAWAAHRSRSAGGSRRSSNLVNDTAPPSARIAERPPPQIAGYEVLRRVGRGGMASVYLARDRRLGRMVALKLLSASEPSEQTVARLRAEAQAIARLQHPNIVQIYEIGDHDGQPYLALEYVSGGSLADSIAGTPRPPREAAQLVEVLARAVHAAHQHGVVHRDLKPGNVLLHKDNGNGERVPKITDFGLAILLDTDSRQTQSGIVVGTASYMAPEQAGADKSDVGPPADTYALGAILYELLTGRPPFKAATVFETALLVRRTEVVAPRLLQPHTPRDLETICLKCLQKEPARRFSSAQELADDLRRFLAGEPVLARPVGSFERVCRWGRRNPLVAGLVAAVAVALMLGTIVSSYFAIQANRRAREAEARTRQAELVSGYLANAFRSADPERDGRAVTVVEVLDRTAARLATDFADQPLIHADLAAAIGQTYLGLGLAPAAVQLLEQSHALVSAHAGADDPRALAARHLLSRAYRATGQLDKAVALAEDAFERVRRVRGEEHQETMQALNSLASAYQDVGRMKEALELHRRTLEWARDNLGDTNPQTLSAMNNVAWLYHRLGRMDEALPLYEQALAGFRSVVGPDQPQTLATMNNLATAYLQMGQPERGAEMLQYVLTAARAQLGDDHPNTLITLANLARAYRQARMFEQAIALMRQAVEQKRDKLGDDHPDTINSHAGLAGTYSAAGMIDQSLPIYEDVLRRRRAQLGNDHADTLASMNGLARTYQLAGQPDRAESLLRECLAIRRRVAPDNWGTFDAEIILGGVLLELNRPDEAEPLLVSGYEGMHARREQVPPENRGRIGYGLQRLVELYESRDNAAEAARWRKKLESFSADAPVPSGDD